MKYIVINKSNRHNIQLSGHWSNDEEMVVNEKEIMSIPDLQGTLDERLLSIDGKEYSLEEIKKIIESWQIIQ
jgi:hypothetical protein